MLPELSWQVPGVWAPQLTVAPAGPHPSQLPGQPLTRRVPAACPGEEGASSPVPRALPTPEACPCPPGPQARAELRAEEQRRQSP